MLELLQPTIVSNQRRSNLIVFLAKVCETKEHAEAFLKGSMYANRLSYFKNLEGAYGRGDEYEGAIMPLLMIRLYAKGHGPDHRRSSKQHHNDRRGSCCSGYRESQMVRSLECILHVCGPI